MADAKVYTVKLAVVKPEVVARYLADRGLPIEGTVADQVKALVEAIKADVKAGTITKQRLGQCDTCGGYSDLLLTECPYCGDRETIEEGAQPATAPAAKPKQAPPVDQQPSPATESAQKPAVAKRTRAEAKAAAKKGKEKPVTEPEAEKPAETPTPVVTGSKPPVAKKAKKGAAKARQSAETVLAPEAVEAAAVVVDAAEADGAVVDTKYTVRDLDESVQRLVKAAVDTASGLYRYGQELQQIHDRGLWKLRPGEGKKDGPAYRSFEQFCRDEVQLSRQHAYRLMAVTSNYTETQLEQYGLSKLHLALQVPEELRTKLLGDGTASARNISDRARQLAKGETEARHTPKADRSKAVTCAIVPGIVELPMQKRPAGDHITGKLTTPAMTLSDEPWCRLPLTNDVFLTIRLTRNDKGEIIAIVEHRRGTERA